MWHGSYVGQLGRGSFSWPDHAAVHFSGENQTGERVGEAADASLAGSAEPTTCEGSGGGVLGRAGSLCCLVGDSRRLCTRAALNSSAIRRISSRVGPVVGSCASARALSNHEAEPEPTSEGLDELCRTVRRGRLREREAAKRAGEVGASSSIHVSAFRAAVNCLSA